jgi:hypothetical protein
MFFVQKLEPATGAPGCGQTDPDSRPCSPEPPSQGSRKVVSSHYIKGKLRESFTGTVVRAMRDKKDWIWSVQLHKHPKPIGEVKVRLGNTRGFYQTALVRVDVIPNSSSDRTPRHVIGMGAEGASGKRKRE